MTFVDAVKVCFKKYADFSGTASRTEYWYFRLFYVLVYMVSFVFDLRSNGSAGLSNLVGIALILPSWAVTFRRYRDAGFGPAWLLTALLPIAGTIAWFALVASKVTEQQWVQLGSVLTGNGASPLSDAQMNTLFTQIFTSDIAGAAIVVGLVWLLVGAFLFIITVLPSKTIEQGNKALGKKVAPSAPTE